MSDKKQHENIESKSKQLISSCCSFEMVPPDWDMAEKAGSLWRAYACYICKKCSKPCKPLEKNN